MALAECDTSDGHVRVTATVQIPSNGQMICVLFACERTKSWMQMYIECKWTESRVYVDN